jgi:hypothetical protein
MVAFCQNPGFDRVSLDVIAARRLPQFAANIMPQNLPHNRGLSSN